MKAKSEKAFSDRIESLCLQGHTQQEARDIARKEFRALNEARRAAYRQVAIKEMKKCESHLHATSVTPRYGQSSRVGKIDPFSKHNKPSQSLEQLRKELSSKSYGG